MNNGNRFVNFIMHASFVVFSLCCVLPVMVVLSSSLSAEKEIMINGFSLVPQGFTFEAYKSVLFAPEMIVRAYLNSIFVSVIGTSAGLWLITSLAYVLCRKDFFLRNKLSFYVFFTMLFNGGLVPFYILIAVWMHLKNNMLALILPYLVNAWYILLMKGFLREIPESLIESAKIDGARELRIFAGIVLPISKPAIATVGLFLVLQYWNDWWLPLLFVEKDQYYTLQFLLMRILMNMEFLASNLSKLLTTKVIEEIPSLSARFAMCVVATGPMLFIFMFFQKYFIKGITMGSIKG